MDPNFLENHMALPPHETGERYMSPALTARIEQERNARIDRAVIERLRDHDAARATFERASDAIALEGLIAHIIKIVGAFQSAPADEAHKCGQVRQALADIIRGYLATEISFASIEQAIGEEGR